MCSAWGEIIICPYLFKFVEPNWYKRLCYWQTKRRPIWVTRKMKDEVGGPYVVCKSTSSVWMKQKRICRGRMKGTRINLSWGRVLFASFIKAGHFLNQKKIISKLNPFLQCLCIVSIKIKKKIVLWNIIVKNCGGRGLWRRIKILFRSYEHASRSLQP